MGRSLPTGSRVRFPNPPVPACGGFTYLGLLFIVAALGLAMALAAQVWETGVRREKERELLFVGSQIRQAIGSYYEATPDGDKRFPQKLEDLLLDNRFHGVKRHLRKLYRDPVTGAVEWGLVMSGEGGIQGIYSLSPLVPFKQSGFDAADMDFENKPRYSEWKFVHVPSQQAHAQADH